MAMSNTLQRGVELVSAVATVYIGVFALLFIGTLFLGVVANLVASGDIGVSGEYSATNGSGISGAIYDIETNYQESIDLMTNPITVIASLVIVGVLVMMFPGLSGSRGKSGDVL